MHPRSLLRILLLALIVAGANFGGFAYAHLARTMPGNPFFGGRAAPNGLWPAYIAYVQGMATGQLANVAVYGADFGAGARQCCRCQLRSLCRRVDRESGPGFADRSGRRSVRAHQAFATG